MVLVNLVMKLMVVVNLLVELVVLVNVLLELMVVKMKYKITVFADFLRALSLYFVVYSHKTLLIKMPTNKLP